MSIFIRVALSPKMPCCSIILLLFDGFSSKIWQISLMGAINGPQAMNAFQYYSALHERLVNLYTLTCARMSAFDDDSGTI